MPPPRCPCIIPCIMSCIMLQSPFCIRSTWARTCFRNSANFEGSLGVNVSRAPFWIGSYFIVPGNICPCIIDSLGRSTACMVAICSARRRNSATFSGFVVVMDSATPVAVSVAATDVPSRFIGQAIIMPRPCMGMPGFGCGVLFCSPAANIAAGIRNSTASFLTITSSKKTDLVCSKHANLHIPDNYARCCGKCAPGFKGLRGKLVKTLQGGVVYSAPTHDEMSSPAVEPGPLSDTVSVTQE